MKRTILFLAVLTLAGTCYAQTEEKKSTEEAKFYRLDFVLKELESGKVTNTRSYTMNIASSLPFNSSSVRIGDRVPVPSGKDGQFNFIDVGVNIDCHLMRATENQITVQVIADISSVAAAGNPPLINQTKWNGGATVPLRKATTLFSADGASTKRQMQLELTATPVP